MSGTGTVPAKDGGEIAINANKNAFSLVTRIQDEVHRYTIDFSRKKSSKKWDGIGYDLSGRDRTGESESVVYGV